MGGCPGRGRTAEDGSDSGGRVGQRRTGGAAADAADGSDSGGRVRTGKAAAGGAVDVA